jgi:galactitol-specific phosphotransferase system IIB component
LFQHFAETKQDGSGHPGDPLSTSSTVQVDQNNQDGSGFTNPWHLPSTSTVATHVVNKILEKLQSDHPSVKKVLSEIKELVPQAPIIVSSSEPAQINFDNQITAADENDCFDEEKLLKLIPHEDRKKAEELLNEFDTRGNEITWNPSGVIFIDQVSIPHSNIYEILPLVYKKKHPSKSIIGLQEFISKVNVMGYGNLINLKIPKSYKRKSEMIGEGQALSYENWWYIGP